MTDEELKKVQAKKSFIIQKSLEHDIEAMTGEEVKFLMQIIFATVSRGETFDLSHPNNRAVKVAFNRFIEDYKRDNIAWIETCSQNRENIRKRWNKNKWYWFLYDGIGAYTVEYECIRIIPLG